MVGVSGDLGGGSNELLHSEGARLTDTLPTSRFLGAAAKPQGPIKVPHVCQHAMKTAKRLGVTKCVA